MTRRPICVDHLTLPVSDLERSVRFYRAALVDGLGWREELIDGRPTFGPEGSEDVSLGTSERVAPVHLAFSASSRDAVAAFHASGLAAGGRDNGGPGTRERYSPGYYAAFLLDPDGHNVEAVLHEGPDGPQDATSSGADVADWVRRYEAAWRTPGTAAVGELFAEGATYRAAPFQEPLAGLPAIERFWDDGRDGPDEPFAMRSEVVATTGPRSVVRVEVRYERPERRYRDLWIVDLDPDGRCTAFEEWPFHPGSPRVAPAAGEREDDGVPDA